MGRARLAIRRLSITNIICESGSWPIRARRAGGYCGSADMRGSIAPRNRVLREVRPAPKPTVEVRLETALDQQAQVDFAKFKTVFEDDPSEPRIV